MTGRFTKAYCCARLRLSVGEQEGFTQEVLVSVNIHDLIDENAKLLLFDGFFGDDGKVVDGVLEFPANDIFVHDITLTLITVEHYDVLSQYLEHYDLVHHERPKKPSPVNLEDLAH